MNRYKVFGGLAHIGAGVAVMLSPEQIRPRSHNLELPPDYKVDAKDAKPAVVKSKAPLQFKVGEIIGLDDVPKNLIGIVEPQDAVKTERDKQAAEAALMKKYPQAHTAKTAHAEKASAAAKAASKPTA